MFRAVCNPPLPHQPPQRGDQKRSEFFSPFGGARGGCCRTPPRRLPNRRRHFHRSICRRSFARRFKYRSEFKKNYNQREKICPAKPWRSGGLFHPRAPVALFLSRARTSLTCRCRSRAGERVARTFNYSPSEGVAPTFSSGEVGVPTSSSVGSSSSGSGTGSTIISGSDSDTGSVAASSSPDKGRAGGVWISSGGDVSSPPVKGESEGVEVGALGAESNINPSPKLSKIFASFTPSAIQEKRTVYGAVLFKRIVKPVSSLSLMT